MVSELHPRRCRNKNVCEKYVCKEQNGAGGKGGGGSGGLSKLIVVSGHPKGRCGRVETEKGAGSVFRRMRCYGDERGMSSMPARDARHAGGCTRRCVRVCVCV